MYQNYSKKGEKFSFRALLSKAMLLIPFFSLLLLGFCFTMSGFMNGDNTLISPFASLLYKLSFGGFGILVIMFLLVLVTFVVIEGIETLNMIISDIRNKSSKKSKPEKKNYVPAEWKEFTQKQVEKYKEMEAQS